jgi:hypothetical protein
MRLFDVVGDNMMRMLHLHNRPFRNAAMQQTHDPAIIISAFEIRILHNF